MSTETADPGTVAANLTLKISPAVVLTDVAADSSILSPEQVNFLFHPSKPPCAAKIEVGNPTDEGQHVRLRIELSDPFMDRRWIQWRRPIRTTMSLGGGASVDAQDTWIPDSAELILFVRPDSNRVAILDFEIVGDSDTRTGDYEFGISAVNVSGGATPHKTIECEVKAELQVRHPESEILELLPGIYQEAMLDLRRNAAPGDDGPFFDRYLRGFDDVIGPIRATLSRLEELFGAFSTPSPFVLWLATWVAMPLNENWPEMRRRLLIGYSIELFRKRGTKAGLLLFLKIYSGEEAEIDDMPTYGMRLGSLAKLSTSGAVLGDISSFTFNVRLTVPDLSLISEVLIREIIESYKPAHTAYNLQLVEGTRPQQPEKNNAF